MSLKKAKLNIVLKSDLCVGSGYSYAGIIDTDVCYNDNGIPYIPARRIKGCLREAAELIGIDTNSIFGERGGSSIGKSNGEPSMGNVSIGNAYPAGYMDIDDKITELKNLDSEELDFKNILSTQKVLEQFTYIKAQTAIDKNNGSSKENSLRYTRVVNRYSGEGGSELSFIADIEFSCDDVDIINCAKALRHIGMNRNRGLGNVRCYIDDIKPCNDLAINLSDSNDSEKEVCLKYVIKNVNPLMLSGNNDGKSERYINGQSVIGALAARYIAIDGKSADDDLFYDLFLNGKVKYSNLYITEKKPNKNDKYVFNDFAPAPLFINKLKKTKKVVNVTTDFEKCDDKFKIEGGNQPKKLKGKFISLNDNSINIKEPLLDIVYHHSKYNHYSYNSGRNEDNEGILYYLEVVKENQYFSGSIVGKKKYIDFILNILENYPLRFGKSKTAQYGKCVLVQKEITDYDFKFDVKKDEKIIVVFESDAVFQNENGFTVRCDDVKKIVADSFGIKYRESDDKDKSSDKKCDTFLETEVKTGYSTVWNLKKPSLPAIKAGSAITYELTEDVTIKSEYVGVKNTEGFGKIKIYKYSQLPDIFEENKPSDKGYVPEKSLKLMENILLKDFVDAIKEGSMKTEVIKISASTIGRVTLMLKESLDSNKVDYKLAFEDFKKRVNSIKRTEEKRKVAEFLVKYLCTEQKIYLVGDVDVDKFTIDVRKIIGNKNSDSYKIYSNMEKLGVEGLNEKIEKLWGKYLESILVFQKYSKKED